MRTIKTSAGDFAAAAKESVFNSKFIIEVFQFNNVIPFFHSKRFSHKFWCRQCGFCHDLENDVGHV
jgi:hypothetical protein